MRRRRSVTLVALALLLAACAAVPPVSDPSGVVPSAPGRPPGPTATPPAPGHELYGFVPYWEMDDGIAAHLRETPLTTLALFSVTHTAKGALATGQQGYRKITGDPGRRLIAEAHDRGTRVDLVYSSFGGTRNERLFTSDELQAAVIDSLVRAVDETGVDGLNVDVEGLDPLLVPAYGAWLGRLRERLRATDATRTMTVSTGAGPLGAAMALAAFEAGADRIFLMGYDYRVAGSSPGATAPLDRSDGGGRDLRRSLDLYLALGVAPERLILGLPLYGMTWPVAGPVVGAPATGRGEAWIPRRNLDLLRDPAAQPVRDDVEQVDVYFLASDGTIGPPPPDASPGPAELARTWTAVYVDSPETLVPKLALADEHGLAGAAFWAIGYERGLPGYRDLMTRFVDGRLR